MTDIERLEEQIKNLDKYDDDGCGSILVAQFGDYYRVEDIEKIFKDLEG